MKSCLALRLWIDIISTLKKIEQELKTVRLRRIPLEGWSNLSPISICPGWSLALPRATRRSPAVSLSAKKSQCLGMCVCVYVCGVCVYVCGVCLCMFPCMCVVCLCVSGRESLSEEVSVRPWVSQPRSRSTAAVPPSCSRPARFNSPSQHRRASRSLVVLYRLASRSPFNCVFNYFRLIVISIISLIVN